MRRTDVLLGVATVAAIAVAPLARPAVRHVSAYTPAAPAPMLTLLLVRGNQAGYVNDTAAYSTPDGLVWHVAPYAALPLAELGVPASATAVRVTAKAVITKGAGDGTVSVFMFARQPYAVCCGGPPGHERQPIDSNEGQPVRGMIEQAVAQHAGDGVRALNEVTIPVTDGTLEWSWGYRESVNDGQAWPLGDAVAVNLYLDGWEG